MWRKFPSFAACNCSCCIPCDDLSRFLSRRSSHTPLCGSVEPPSRGVRRVSACIPGSNCAQVSTASKNATRRRFAQIVCDRCGVALFAGAFRANPHSKADLPCMCSVVA
ncbi:hypothetical protein RGUI_3402 [Rhodovulum sp. P5]|nr:hypothetical protein RGUI_3402 [Rhodovulum sp. P5]